MLFERQELYHPALVHFPIAISILWCVIEFFFLMARKRRKEMDPLFLLLAVIGVVTAFLCNLTGEWAEGVHKAAGYSAAAMQALEAHEEIATYVIWFFVALTAISGIILFLSLEWLRILRFGVACGLAIIVAIAANRGGILVYEYGFAVKGVEHGRNNR